MNYTHHLFLPFYLGILLTGCSTVKAETPAPEKSTETVCHQVKELMANHKTGFKDLKENYRPTHFMEIWDAKYQLVGKNCQIWRWADGKQVYKCTETFPDEEAAQEKYIEAVNFSKQCLGNEWTVENVERNEGRAMRTIFSSPGQETVASVNRITTEKLFSTKWTIYYFIGDRDKSF